MRASVYTSLSNGSSSGNPSSDAPARITIIDKELSRVQASGVMVIDAHSSLSDKKKKRVYVLRILPHGQLIYASRTRTPAAH